MATDLCMGIPSPVRSATENLVFHRNVGGLLPTPTRQLARRSSFYNGGAILLPDALTATASRITMRVASKNAYICRDCGYIYNDRKPFEQLPDDYSCPVCSASKKRFRPYQDVVAKDANDLKVRKARKEKLKQVDSAIGSALPIGVAIGVLALIGVYIYVNQI